MRFGSLFSGIGGFDLGLERAGMQCTWQVEIDPHCQKLLEQKLPDAKRFTDVRNVGRHNLESVDLVCGGFPCQDLSVAGKRAGLAGERSGLWHEFHRIVAETKPRWVVIENVPGLLSSNNGQDFAVVLRGLVECGYGVAYRILDARYFGVAQRRRRVFIVASLGNGRCAQVLFESEGMSGDIAESREAREGFAAVAGTLSANRGGLDRPAGNANELDFCIPVGKALTSKNQRNDYETENLIAFSADRDGMDATENLSPTMRHGGSEPSAHNAFKKMAIAFMAGQGAKAGSVAASDTTFPTLKGVSSGLNQVPSVSQGIGVRRLTPVECERLQGFPDHWTDGFADSIRYRMLGNAVCVSNAEWIARRIIETELA